MLTGKYVNVERVISGVMRDFKYNTDFDWLDAVEWIGDCLSLIGTAGQYLEKVTDGNRDLNHPDEIVIENYRGKLPADIVYIMQAWNCETNSPMKYSTDTFHTSYFCEGYTKCDATCRDTYKLNNDYIFTSFEEGTVKIAYRSFPTDADGLPLIPDHQSFIEACKWYVIWKLAFKLLLQDRIGAGVYNEITTQKDWYVGQAQVKASMPNYDKMDGIQSMFLKLIPSILDNRNRYGGISNLEKRFNNNLNR